MERKEAKKWDAEKVAKFEKARRKGLQVWRSLKELEQSYNTKLDLALYEFNDNYLYLITQIDSVREEGFAIAERLKSIDTFKTVLSTWVEGFNNEPFSNPMVTMSVTDYENKLSYENMVNLNLEKQLMIEADQMRALTVIEFMESGEISRYPELANLKKNIDKLRDILHDTIEEAEKLRKEIATSQNIIT